MKHKLKTVYLIILYVAAISFGLSLYAGSNGPVTDLSEKIFRLNWGFIFHPDSQSFGVHDSGDKKIKILDWNFNVIKEIPIHHGEGPGEIKIEVMSVTLLENKTYAIHGVYERRINIFDSNGLFVSSFPTSFRPLKILSKGNLIYAINSKIEFSDNDHFFMEIFNGKTGKSIKKVRFQEIIAPNAPKVNQDVFALNIRTDVNGNIWFLYGAVATLYKVDAEGKLLKKVKLPYQDKKIIYRDKKTNVPTTSWKKIYSGLAIDGETVYTMIHIHSEKEKEKDDSRLIKVDVNGNYFEKRFAERFCLLGIKENSLFLIQDLEYFATTAKVSELKKRD